MDGEAVDFFNNIGAGTFICILIAIGSLGAYVFEKIKSYKKAQKIKIEEEIKDEMEYKQLSENMTSLMALVPQIKKIAENVENLQTNYEKHLIEGKREFDELANKVENSESRLDAHDRAEAVDIRAFILSEYQKWMPLGYIDVYSLSVIKDKFNIYKNELHANHFVAEQVNQLSNLQPKYIITDTNGQDPIKYFSNHPDDYPFKQNRICGDIIVESE